MKGFGDQYPKKEKVKNKNINFPREKVVNKALLLHSQGNIKEAIKYYQYCIDQKIDNFAIYSNYGLILNKIGHSDKSEIYLRKAIQLNPTWSEGHTNLGIILKSQGKLNQAEIYLRKAIELNSYSALGYSNLGNTLRELKKFQEAEIYLRKAIELNPASIMGYANLGNMLKGIGRLKEAKELLLKTIEIDPEFVRAYYSLSRLDFKNTDKIWYEYLFSKKFLNNKTDKEKIDIYFARSNLLHKEKKFLESAKNIKMANALKLKLNPSESKSLIKRSKFLLNESLKKDTHKKNHKSFPLSIFIVGMPRSGSTLIESILSMNKEVKDLGETNILEKLITKKKTKNLQINLTDLYMTKLNEVGTGFTITTNKWLYNYQYVGIIANQISNCKIIYCFRNPLDNILSICRANFDKGNNYSCSIVDTAEVYLDHLKIMKIYKEKFPSIIYDLDYDIVVKQPHKAIKSLIKWLGWEWNDAYLSPHLNKRAVFTASDVQVRYPINSKSIGGWKNYETMLKPAYEILKDFL